MTNDFDLPTIRKQLDALRLRHGANTPIGHRCSNLIGQLEFLPLAPNPDVRLGLEKKIAKSVAELALLTTQ